MRIERTKLLTVLSEALDSVEKEFLGVTDHHAKRVALLCDRMAEKLGMADEERSAVVTGALLHDSALNEYRESYGRVTVPMGALQGHCVVGEENLRLVPGAVSRDFVRYHHERADGKGPFGKRAAETPLGAQLIHIADQLDRCHPVGSTSCDKLREFVQQNRGTLFTDEMSDLALSVLSEELIDALSPERIEDTVPAVADVPCETDLRDLATLFARIIDYKSPFTGNHSLGIAEKAERMARHYGWDEETAQQLYCAGALHDIGKLMVDKDVLEKPGRLDEKEYRHIQSHAYETNRLLSKLGSLGQITPWASQHHEKLNGKGYPLGLTAEELDEKSRLLACLDIYQALTEDRPYKAGMPHGKAISILRELAEKGELDGKIIEDIHLVFCGEETAEEVGTAALFQCPVCGHIYEGDTMPVQYSCPVCGQRETSFLRIR
ncbi:MAG: HD domain-containing protein [Oscillospiraceae bacterium]|nr:HD domain-containing protein [Oscillospiraceae bacterium]